MDIVKTDNLPHGQMPTVFEDRTLFPPPPVIDARYTERKGSWVLPAVIFGFMLLPLAGLGGIAYYLNGELNTLKAAGNTDKITALEADIVALKEQNASLEQQNTQIISSRGDFDKDIGRLIKESAALVADIDDLRKYRTNSPRIEDRLRKIPDNWDDDAIAKLQMHVDELKLLRTKVLETPERRPVGPTVPDIQ